MSMKNQKRSISLAILLTSSLVFALQNGNLSLDSKLQFQLNGGKTALLSFGLIDKDGNNLMPGDLQVKGDAKELILLNNHPACHLKIIISARGRMLVADTQITGMSENDLLLEPCTSLSFAQDAKFIAFWDGFNKTIPIGEKSLTRSGIKGPVARHILASLMPFPANAVFDGKDVYFIGFQPYEYISYSATSYDPAQKKLTASVRVVVSKGQTVRFLQTVGATSAPYGVPEAIVQQYYDTFPEAWQITGGQDNPYIWGITDTFKNWKQSVDFECNRRMYMSLCWAYVPYRRAGDMVCRPELWDYVPFAGKFHDQKWELGGIHIKFNETLEQYKQLRTERFKKYGMRVGWMFYNSTSGTWCEEKLARERYADSIVDDKDIACAYNSWATYHDKEVRVFPYGTSFEKVMKEDQAELLKTLDMPGFAFDCSCAGAFYRGPAVSKPLDGRAWDDHGVFIDQSVAINKLIDYTRTLRCSDGSPVTIFFNGTLKGDYSMFETPYVKVGMYKRLFPLARWYRGPRPGTTHGHGYCIHAIAPDWRNYTREGFLDMVGKLCDFMILNQFKWGLTNEWMTMPGNPQMVYVQPEALELMRALWQAEVPVQFDGSEPRYCSRYGKDVSTYLAFGNSSELPMQATLKIDNSRLNDTGDNLLFVRKMRDGATTENRFDQRYTLLDTDFPWRVPVLFEAIGAMDHPCESIKVSVAKHVDRQSYTIIPGQSGSSVFRFRQVRNFVLDSVRMNGQLVQLDNGKSVLAVTFTGGDEITATYLSTIFKCTKEEILDFPYLNEHNEVSFRIYAVPGTEAACGRILEYFIFCRDNQIISKGSGLPQLNYSSIPQSAPGVMIIKLGASEIVRSPEGALVVSAPDIKTLIYNIEALQRILDERFEYQFGFRSVMGLYQSMIRHFNIAGEVLPLNRYFEAEQ